MGVFNGDSIYNAGGGGGGGLNNGGAITSPSPVPLENNNFYTYENNDSLLNFYVDSEDPLNIIVEIDNKVNATINVLQKKEGIFQSLNNNGLTNLDSGKKYYLHILPGYFFVDEIFENNLNYALINNQVIQVVKISGLWWTAEDYEDGYFSYNQVININSSLTDGWRVAGSGDYGLIRDEYDANVGFKLKSTTDWKDGGNGDNSLGFNGYPKGYYYNGNLAEFTETVYYGTPEKNIYSQWPVQTLQYNSSIFNQSYLVASIVDRIRVRIRLCKTVEV